MIISGTSAGGLATYIHSNKIRDVIPASAALRAVPDAGYFVDLPSTRGQYIYRESVQNGYALWNASTGADSKCWSSYGESDRWRCLMAQYTFPFSTVPTYILNSAIDAASMGFIYDVGCSLTVNTTGNCNASQVRDSAVHNRMMMTMINGGADVDTV